MSPFDPNIVINPTCTVGFDELDWRFSASGGPGGQHANTSNTKAELIFDINASPTLTQHQKMALVDRYGPIIRIVSSEERSQTRNREIAIARFTTMLANGLKVRRTRTPTRPTKGSKERRLQEKQSRSAQKQQRRRPDIDS